MSTVASTGPCKSIAVTLIGLMTILWGGIYAVLGGSMIFAGDAIVTNIRPDDPVGGFAPIFKILASLMIVIGVVLLLQGIPGILAGWGVLLRKQWGRILTFIAADTTPSMWSIATPHRE